MSKLVNIPSIDQNQLLSTYSFAIKKRENALIFGPSGAGKTEMAFQAARQCGYNCIYWNMSVMERPDIQGLPALSLDKRTSFFAPQEGMPFIGLDDLKQRRALDTIINVLGEDDPECVDFLKKVKTLSQHVSEREAGDALKTVKDLFTAKEIAPVVKRLLKAGSDVNVVGNEDSKNVLLLDEVDKTPPENLQPLLELLLYKTINGRPLDISCVLMTANLPDEHTFSEPLSHAITNRSMVYELIPNPKVWVRWAQEHDLHSLVTGFLSIEENAGELFNKRPVNDVFCYAYTSPRAWTACSRVNFKVDELIKETKDEKEAEAFNKMRSILNSSIIGEEASARIDVWFKYYSKYDSFVEEIFNGAMVNIKTAMEKIVTSEKDDEVHVQIVVALALANKFCYLARTSDDKNLVHSKIAHIFKWIDKNVAKDIRNTAIRACWGSGFEKHELASSKDVRDMCLDILEEYGQVNKIIGKKI